MDARLCRWLDSSLSDPYILFWEELVLEVELVYCEPLKLDESLTLYIKFQE